MNYIFTTTNLKKLSTTEMITTYYRIIKIIDETDYDIESVDFESAVKMVKDQLPELDKITIKSRALELTETVNKLHARRIQGFRYIRDYVKAAIGSYDEGTVKAGKYLNKWIMLHSKHFPNGSQDRVSHSFGELFDKMKQDSMFAQYINELNLGTTISTLEEINKKYLNARTQRITIMADTRQYSVNTRNIVMNAIKALTQFTNMLYFRTLIKVEGTEDLVANLRTESEKTRALVRRAQTLRDKKRNKNSDDFDDNKEDEDEIKESGMPTQNNTEVSLSSSSIESEVLKTEQDSSNAKLE